VLNKLNSASWPPTARYRPVGSSPKAKRDALCTIECFIRLSCWGVVRAGAEEVDESSVVVDWPRGSLRLRDEGEDGRERVGGGTVAEDRVTAVSRVRPSPLLFGSNSVSPVVLAASPISTSSPLLSPCGKALGVPSRVPFRLFGLGIRDGPASMSRAGGEEGGVGGAEVSG
jgi:hypothetical protein